MVSLKNISESGWKFKMEYSAFDIWEHHTFLYNDLVREFMFVYWVKRPLERPRRRWEDNIKIVLQEVGRDYGDWME